MANLIPFVLLLPLLGVIVNGFFGYRLGRRLVGLIGTGAVALAFLLSCAIVFGLSQIPNPEERVFSVTLYEWITAGSFRVPLTLTVDALSGLMILIVTGIGFLIHLYSTGYMQADAAHSRPASHESTDPYAVDEPGYARFFTYLNLFVFSMLILVLGANFLLLFVGWELVGLCSYLLISFWFSETANADAGRKAFVVNRIGDFGFALGIMAIFAVFGTLNYTEVFERAPEVLPYGGFVVTAITLLLFVGAVGKSAQIPLFVWLPDAMAGPTPVSALIHAATMVTAGVYMITRANVMFTLAPTTQAVVATVGIATAVVGGFIAITQVDIKRVLAYSTVSQLGLMVLGVGVGGYIAGMFHLFTHAFFKALLFLAAGAVMHALVSKENPHGEQDMRRMGGLRRYIPWTSTTFIIGAVALAAVFPLSGFWSKDEILHDAFARGGYFFVLGLFGLVVTAFTAFYSMRQVGMVFFGPERWREKPPAPAALPGAPSAPSAAAPAAAAATAAAPTVAPVPASPAPSAPAETAPGEKPRRPRPGQAPAPSAAAPAEPTAAAEPTPPAAEAPGEKPKRPRPGQTIGATPPPAPSASEPLTPAADAPAAAEAPAAEPPSAAPAEKPKRPRPGQAPLGATPPAAPSASEPVPPPAAETPAAETPAAASGEKPKRPRPGQAAPAPVTPSVSEPTPAETPSAEASGEKPRRPRPGQAPAAPVAAAGVAAAAATPAPESVAAAETHAPAGGHEAHAGHDDHHGQPHESPWNMVGPLVVLAIGAAIAGFAGSALEHWLEPVIATPPIPPPNALEIAPIITIILSQIIVIPSALLAMSMYNVPLFGIKLPQVTTPEAMGARFQRLYRWSLDKLYWDEAYHKAFVAPFIAAAAWLAARFDHGVIDGAVNWVGRATLNVGNWLRRGQTGYVRNYAVTMLAGVVVLLVWFFFAGR